MSSTSSSSSDAEDEEADGESSGEPPGAPKEDGVLGSGSAGGEEGKVGSPPPSHPAQQVRLHVPDFPFARVCHLCMFSLNSIIKDKIVSFCITVDN